MTNTTQDGKLDPTKIAILFGAGVSRRGPANLPLADDFLTTLHSAVSTRTGQDISNWRKEDMPQFEVLMDCLRRANGPAFRKLLEIFRKTGPNPNHQLLARLGEAGCWLVTTNFDTNVEVALKKRGARVRSLINAGSAGSFAERGVLVPVLKLHGCITRPGSILATMSGLGRRGSIRSAHLLSVGRQQGLRRFLAGGICCVLGYSGSDTLDILPALQQIRKCRIVQLQHDPTGRLDLTTLRDALQPQARAPSEPRKEWYDHILRGDTTEFLIHLCKLCGIETPGEEPHPTGKPDMRPLTDAIGALTDDEVKQALSEMKGARAVTGEHEEKARTYLAKLRQGKIPVVLVGGAVLFSVDGFTPGRKPSLESRFLPASLSPETRAEICYEVGKALARSPDKRHRPAARTSLRQAMYLWEKLGKTTAQSQARGLLESLSVRPNKNAGPKKSA